MSDPVANLKDTINVANVIDATGAEGPGVRFAVWVQGCSLNCPGCCNALYLKDRVNTLLSVAELLARLRRALKRNPEIEGVTLLGGEPLQQDAALATFAEEAQGLGLSVMVFTGYEEGSREVVDSQLLRWADLVKVGPYLESQRTTAIRWIGSHNQKIVFLTKRYSPRDERFYEKNEVELKLREDGTIQIAGFPFRSVMQAFPARFESLGAPRS